VVTGGSSSGNAGILDSPQGDAGHETAAPVSHCLPAYLTKNGGFDLRIRLISGRPYPSLKRILPGETDLLQSELEFYKVTTTAAVPTPAQVEELSPGGMLGPMLVRGMKEFGRLPRFNGCDDRAGG
jgi:hypothetical protein